MTVASPSRALTDKATAPPHFSKGYLAWLLALLALIYTSNFVDRLIFSALAQPIKRDLNLTDTQLGLLGGLTFAVFYTIMGVPIARLVERKSRIAIITVCIGAWSVMTALCGAAQTFVQLALARVGVGVGEAGCLPAAHSLISDHFPPSKRATALAIFSMGIPLGSLIGAVAGGWVAQHMNWRLAFVIVGLPGLLLAILTPLTLREPPRGHVEGVDAGGTAAPPLLAVLKRLWRRRSAVWVCAGATTASIGAYGILTFAAAFFTRRHGLDYAQAGLAVGLMSGVGSGVSILGGGLLADWAAKRDLRGYAWVSIVGLVVAMPLYILGFLDQDWATALPLLVVAAVAQQLFLSPTFAIAQNVVEPRMRATSIALMAVSWNLIGQGRGPVMVGFVSDTMATAMTANPSVDVLHLCRQAACADASASGLQYALVAMPVVYAVAAVFFFMSARRMREDLAPGR